jgi:hypothetical protein
MGPIHVFVFWGGGGGEGEGKGREGGVNKQNGGQTNKDPSRQISISFPIGTTNVYYSWCVWLASRYMTFGE